MWKRFSEIKVSIWSRLRKYLITISVHINMWKHKKTLKSNWSRLLNYITTISCHNDESVAVVVTDDASSSSLLLLLSAAGHNASEWAPIECLTAVKNWIRLYAPSITPWCVCRSACSISCSDAGSPRVFHPCYLLPPFPLPRFQRPLAVLWLVTDRENWSSNRQHYALKCIDRQYICNDDNTISFNMKMCVKICLHVRERERERERERVR